MACRCSLWRRATCVCIAGVCISIDINALKVTTAADKFKSLDFVEGMTIDAIKGLNIVMGANRVAFRPKGTHPHPDFPQNDLPEAFSYCRVYKENRNHNPTKFVIKTTKVGSGVGDDSRFFGGSRTDWLAFFGPTASGECATYPGKTNSGLSFSAISDVKDGSRCAWECARSERCGHWVHDIREKKCFLYTTRWDEANAAHYPTGDTECGILDGEIVDVLNVASDCTDLHNCADTGKFVCKGV